MNTFKLVPLQRHIVRGRNPKNEVFEICEFHDKGRLVGYVWLAIGGVFAVDDDGTIIVFNSDLEAIQDYFKTYEGKTMSLQAIEAHVSQHMAIIH